MSLQSSNLPGAGPIFPDWAFESRPYTLVRRRARVSTWSSTPRICTGFESRVRKGERHTSHLRVLRRAALGTGQASVDTARFPKFNLEKWPSPWEIWTSRGRLEVLKKTMIPGLETLDSKLGELTAGTANLRTKILGFRGFDSRRI